MLSLLLNLSMILFCGLIFKLPYVGVMLYYWFSILNPQRLVWGGADIRWSLLVVVLLMVSLIFTKKSNFKINWIAPVRIFMAFFLWTCLTTIFAKYSQSTDLYITFLKTFLMTMMVIGMTDSREKLNAIVWVVVLSAGVYVLREGGKTILSGGTHHTMGPLNTPYAGNNEVGRLFGMALPFILFLAYHTKQGLMRKSLFLLLFIDIIAIIGTNSRGAFMGLIAAAAILFLRSQRKFMFLIIAGIAVMGVQEMQSDAGEKRSGDRYSTIESYDADKSFQGRMFAWNYAMHDVMEESAIMGLGFGAFRGAITHKGTWKDAHSIYFEALGEHGIIGFSLYLLLLLSTINASRRLEKLTKGNPSLYWERDLIVAIQVFIAFFMVGGITISHTYIELYYLVIAMLAILDRQISTKLAETHQ